MDKAEERIAGITIKYVDHTQYCLEQVGAICRCNRAERADLLAIELKELIDQARREEKSRIIAQIRQFATVSTVPKHDKLLAGLLEVLKP